VLSDPKVGELEILYRNQSIVGPGGPWVDSKKMVYDSDTNILKPVEKENDDDDEIINISDNEGTSTSHQIISNDKDDLFMLWQDNSTGNHDIYFSQIEISDNTLNVNKTLNLSNSSGISSDPKIDFFGSNIYVIWEEYVPTKGPDIFFRSSFDNGNSFGNITNLSNSITDSSDFEVGSYTQIGDIGVDNSGTIYIVWTDLWIGLPQIEDVTLSKSYNNGTTFTVPKNIENLIGSAYEPKLVKQRENMYVVWKNDDWENKDVIDIENGNYTTDIFLKQIN
jgi:hypothetical protein